MQEEEVGETSRKCIWLGEGKRRIEHQNDGRVALESQMLPLLYSSTVGHILDIVRSLISVSFLSCRTLKVVHLKN